MKYVRKTVTLPEELVDRMNKAIARRQQIGMGNGSCSEVVRIALVNYLTDFECRTGTMKPFFLGEANAQAVD